MKKILIFIFALIAINCDSQSVTMKSSYNAVSDTVSLSVLNGAMPTAFVSVSVKGSYQAVTVQPVITKLFGKIGGTVVLYGSLDGNNYSAVGTDTFTLTNVASQTHLFTLPVSSQYQYYKVLATGDTTGLNDTCRFTVSANFMGKNTGGVAVIKAMTSSNVVTANRDKVTNGGTDSLSQVATFGYNCVAIQPVVTKVSGTQLCGAKLMVSLDGINFVATGDSLHCTNSSTPFTTIWTLPVSTQYKYYSVWTTGYGTAVSTVNAYFLGK